MSEPLNECAGAPLTPPVERASYLTARVIMFMDIVNRGDGELAVHSAPISNCPECVNGMARAT